MKMKKSLIVAGTAFVLAVLTGCTTVESTQKFNAMGLGTPNEKAVGHTYVEIPGVFLFGLPIVTGSPAGDGEWTMFHWTLNSENAVYLLTVAGTSTYKYAFNTADTRCWELAPKEFYAALIPMPQLRELTISAAGMPSCGVRLPPDAKSAICYIAAPGGNAQIRIIPLKLK